jgi:hypothetical protein
MIILETVRGCVSLKKYKSQGKAVEVTVNSKEENPYDFCLDYVQEFGLCTVRILRYFESILSNHLQPSHSGGKSDI